MTILIENNTKFIINEEYELIIKKIIEEAIKYENCPYEVELSITFVDKNEIKELNHEYRGKNKSTDVLSFPQIDFDLPSNFDFIEEIKDEYFNLDTGDLILGDIVISTDNMILQAREYNHSIERELGFLILHSILHLFGYDHINEIDEKIMIKKQNEILEKVGLKR